MSVPDICQRGLGGLWGLSPLKVEQEETLSFLEPHVPAYSQSLPTFLSTRGYGQLVMHAKS